MVRDRSFDETSKMGLLCDFVLEVDREVIFLCYQLGELLWCKVWFIHIPENQVFVLPALHLEVDSDWKQVV